MSELLDRVRTIGEPFKRELVSSVLPTASLLDAGGMWGVHGAYALHAAEHGARSVLLLDTLSTPEFDAWQRELSGGGVTFVEGDLCDPGTWLGIPKTETSICFEVLMHQAIPLLLLHGLTQVTTKRIVLSASVLPESRFPFPNGCVFLPGMAEPHQDALHPAPGDPVFKVFSSDPAVARSHSEWHWGLTASLVTSWMRYLGWAPEQTWTRPFLRGWEWWQGVFVPAPDETL